MSRKITSDGIGDKSIWSIWATIAVDPQSAVSPHLATSWLSGVLITLFSRERIPTTSRFHFSPLEEMLEKGFSRDVHLVENIFVSKNDIHGSFGTTCDKLIE